MYFRIEQGHMKICNGTLPPVRFGDAETTLEPGRHTITAEMIGISVKIKRFGHVSECLQRSISGYLRSNGNSAILTVVN